MSLVPIICDLAREMDNYANRAFFDDFGFGLYPHQIFQTPRLPRSLFDQQLLQLPFEQLHQLASLRNEKESYTVVKDGFQVSVDVNQFKPNELTVRTADNYVVIEGKHEEREDDHGFIQRHFKRRYLLPHGYNPDQVASTISSDGVLTITAPPPQKAIESNERVVQIQQTGTEHAAIKDKNDTKAIKNKL